MNMSRRGLFPIKTRDLLLMMSNLNHTPKGSLIMIPLRNFPNSSVLELVKYFTNVPFAFNSAHP